MTQDRARPEACPTEACPTRVVPDRGVPDPRRAPVLPWACGEPARSELAGCKAALAALVKDIFILSAVGGSAMPPGREPRGRAAAAAAVHGPPFTRGRGPAAGVQNRFCGNVATTHSLTPMLARTRTHTRLRKCSSVMQCFVPPSVGYPARSGHPDWLRPSQGGSQRERPNRVSRIGIGLDGLPQFGIGAL